MIDALQLQLASAMQRYSTLTRRAETSRDTTALVQRTLAELATALEEVRIAQEQLVENRIRLEQMNEELRRQAERYWELFDEIPLAYLVTRADSTIVEVNKAAAELFNVSQRFLVGKTLSVFVCEDRAPFLGTCARIAEDATTANLTLKLRPRERAPLDISARAVGAGSQVRWLLKIETAVVT